MKIDSVSGWTQRTPTKSDYVSLPSEYETRNIFTTYLKGLLPNTEYVIVIEEPALSIFSDTFYYKTLDPSNFTMMTGGDIGINPESRAMNQMLLDHNADIIMIGGDISYDNNFPQ